MLRGTVRAKERKRKSREVGEVAVLLPTGLTAAGSRAYISSRGSCRLEGTSRSKVITACPVPVPTLPLSSPTHCAEPTPEPDPDGRASTSLDRFPFFLVLLCLLSSLSLLSLSPSLSSSPPLPPFSPHLTTSSSSSTTSSPHPPHLLSPLSFTMYLASTCMYLYSLSVIRYFINTYRYGLRIDGGKYSSYSLQVPSNAFPPRVSKPQASSWLLSANTGTSVPLTFYLLGGRPGRASRVDAVVVHHVPSLPHNHRPAIRRLLSPARRPTLTARALSVLRLEQASPSSSLGLLPRSPPCAAQLPSSQSWL